MLCKNGTILARLLKVYDVVISCSGLGYLLCHTVTQQDSTTCARSGGLCSKGIACRYDPASSNRFVLRGCNEFLDQEQKSRKHFFFFQKAAYNLTVVPR